MRARRSNRNPRRWARRGLTLLEIVLAMGILIAVSSLTYWFYAEALQTSRKGTDAAYRLRLARVVLDRITMEIRQASKITADQRQGVRGAPEHIWLSSHRVPSREQSKERREREDPPVGEYDLTKLEYKIVRHPEVFHEDGYEYPLGLARVEIPIPRPDLIAEAKRKSEDRESGNGGGSDPFDGASDEGSQLIDDLLSDQEEDDASLELDIRWDELYAPEIRYLRFCYSDGHQWWDSWEVTGENPLPQLVMVTIGFEPQPPVGEEFGLGRIAEINEEFCTCMNQDPVECVPLASDQFSTVVRVTQADPLFRSRVTRESQGLMEELAKGEEDDGS